jgi:hypothetical protein
MTTSHTPASTPAIKDLCLVAMDPARRQLQAYAVPEAFEDQGEVLFPSHQEFLQRLSGIVHRQRAQEGKATDRILVASINDAREMFALKAGPDSLTVAVPRAVFMRHLSQVSANMAVYGLEEPDSFPDYA